jgi:muramidase (phage lysozyme)
MQAFLDMLAVSEIGQKLLASSDNGYNVLVGGTLFSGYADHPRKVVDLGKGLKSSAAGRYQILARYFDAYKKILGLKDFSPDSQDAIASKMVTEQRAIGDIEVGDVRKAITKCRNIWASLPGAGYGQHENKMDYLVDAYVKAGGTLISTTSN